MVPRSLPVFLVVSLGVLGCGGAPKAVEAPRAAGCPDDMVEVAAKEGETAFCIDRTEAIVGAYLECVGKARCTPAGDGRECNKDTLATQTHPVNCVDARQAEAFCEAMGRRLPTEKEWDRAARSGKPKEVGAGVCWSGGMPQRGTCATDRRGAEENGGVRDLGGNVAEWTSSGTDTSRVVRGGAYTSTNVNDLRPENRNMVSPGMRNAQLGFRCAKAL